LIWPLVLLISTAAVLLAAFLSWMSPLRALITLWFMVVCPGMALLRVFGLRLPVSGWALAIAFSLALDTAVGIALLYAGKWSWQTGLIILASITVICSLLDLVPRPAAGPQPAIVVTKVPARPRKPRTSPKAQQS
jgi:uncharacterized membrane protein